MVSFSTVKDISLIDIITSIHKIHALSVYHRPPFHGIGLREGLILEYL